MRVGWGWLKASLLHAKWVRYREARSTRDGVQESLKEHKSQGLYGWKKKSMCEELKFQYDLCYELITFSGEVSSLLRIIINNTSYIYRLFSGQSTMNLLVWPERVESVVRRSKKWGWRGGQSPAETRGNEGTTKRQAGNATMRLHGEATQAMDWGQKWGGQHIHGKRGEIV